MELSQTYKIWGSDSSVAEDSNLECDSISLGEQFLVLKGS